MADSSEFQPPPALLIFDCDGVLVDSESISCALLSNRLRAHGLAVDAGYVKRHFLGRSLRSVREHADALGMPLPADFEATLNQALLARFGTELRPVPGVDGLLAHLRRAGIPVCAASSSHLARVKLSLDVTDLAHFFGPHVYTTEMVARGKPAPDIFLYAAAQMDTAPDRSLVIEDSVSGVRAGVAAGMRVWGFVGGDHHGGDDAVASSLRDAGAARVFDRMDAIVAALAGPASPASSRASG
ncbi:HAD family hydrolase [Luteimonas abyssi]|uniref:HAD family hydrolase n=1 Tax=Luteimonas abyssi TaxID=1247514 RepID=UPI000737C578|nr:HAD family hydrolase [Luteimonas abyssi]